MIPTLLESIFAIYLGVQLLFHIVRILQRPEVYKAAIFLWRTAIKTRLAVEQSLTYPTSHPLRDLIASVAMTGLFYFLSADFLLWYALFGVCTAVKGVTLSQTSGGMLLTLFYLLAARWYFVLAERERLAVVGAWKAYRAGKCSHVRCN